MKKQYLLCSLIFIMLLNLSFHYMNAANLSSTVATDHSLPSVNDDDCTISSFPYTEDFENCTVNSLPDCYAEHHTTTSVYPKVINTNANNSTKCLDFYCQSLGSKYSMLVFPQIDNSVSISELQISFAMKRTSSGGVLQVGVMTDPTDPSTFVEVSSLSNEGYNSYETHALYLNSYTGNGQYLAFKWIGSSSCHAYIDDIVIDEAGCAPPTNLTLTQVNGSNATLDWEPSATGNPSGYYVEYCEAGTENWVYDYAETMPHIITGLSEATNYTLLVYADCYSDTVWTAFTTPCNNGVNITIGNTTSSTYGNWLPIATDVYSYSQQLYRADELGGTPAEFRSIAFQYFYDTPVSRNLSIYLAHTDSNAFVSSSDWIPDTMLTLVFSGTVDFNNGNDNYWFQIPFTTPFNYDGTSNIALVVLDNTGSSSHYEAKFYTHSSLINSSLRVRSTAPLAIGSITAVDRELLAERNNVRFIYCDSSICAMPTNVSVGSITATSAELAWLSVNGEVQWDVEYKTAEDTAWTLISTIEENPYTLETLNPFTNYQVRVRANCGFGLSPWTEIISFATICADLDEMPFMEDFDDASTVHDNTNNGQDDPIVDCWSRYTSNANYNVYVTTGGVNNSHCLDFNNTSNGTVIAALPPISATIPVSELMISFQARTSNPNAGTKEVGVMTDPNDPSTFEPIDTLHLNGANSWYSVDIPLNNYTGEGRYIAFRYSNGGNSQFLVDDVVVDNIPACAKPFALTVTEVNAYDATIEWNEIGSATSWTVVYGAPGFDPDTATSSSMLVESNPYTIENLLPNTNYEVYVKSECPAESSSSEWSVPVTFETGCGYLLELPYEQNFDTYTSAAGSLPFCWSSLYNVYVSEAPRISNDLSATSPNSLKMQAAENYYAYAVLPPMTPDYPINTLQVVLDARFHVDGVLEVGVMEDPDDTTTYTAVYMIEPDALNEWNTYDALLDAYEGSGNYIAFKWHDVNATTYSPVYLDNISVNIIPTCPRPIAVRDSLINGESVKISWTENGTAGAWKLIYGVSGFNPNFAGTIVETNTTSHILTGLQPTTSYDVYVKAICSDSDSSSWSAKRTFVTPCNDLTMLPYTENFDSYGSNGTSVMVPCWTRNSYYTGQPHISSYTSVSEPYSLNLYSQLGGFSYVALQGFDASIPVNTLQLSFELMLREGGDFVVGVMTNPTDTATFEPVETVTVTELDTWESVNVSLADYAGAGRYIAFRYSGITATSAKDAYVDNLIIDDVFACIRPNNVTVDNITTTSAEVSWTPVGIGSSWLVEYGPQGFTLGAGSNVTVQDTFVTLSGLTSNTAYDVYVRTLCGDSDTSAWTLVYTFTTACGDITLPYAENFDGSNMVTNPNDPTDVMVECWSRYTSDEDRFAHVTTSPGYVGPHSAPACLSLDYTPNCTVIAAMPALSATISLNTVMLSFYTRTTDVTTGTKEVGVMTNPNDPTTFETVAVINHDAVNVWQLVEIPFNTYTGTGRYIAFRFTNGNSGQLFIDDVTVDYAPSCLYPVDVEVVNALTTTVELSWTERGTATTWNVEYGPTGFTPGFGTTVVATTNPFTVTGLTPSTTYDFYVQADCGSGDVSEWTEVATATTECGTLTVPYIENFDSYTGTAYNMPGVIPNCWDNFTNGTYMPAPHITGTGDYSYPSSAPNALTFTAGMTGPVVMAILPEFDMALNQLNLTFNYRMENEMYGALIVGYVTDATDPVSTFTVVDSVENTSTITNHEVSFTNLTNVPAHARIAFKWTCSGAHYNCGIDDVVVLEEGTELPTCETPTNLVVSNISQTEATATWTAGGDETAWNVQFKKGSDLDWNNVLNVTNTSYVLTNLTPNTGYFVRVQAVCGGNVTSDWTTISSFTTLSEEGETCPAPTGLEVTDVQNETITLTWSQEANTADNWTVQYRVQGSETWSDATATAVPYTLTGLTGLTTYEIQVLANCTNGQTSDPSNMITVITRNDGISNYDLESSVNLYPNPTADRVTISAQGMMESVSMYDVYGKLINMMKVNDTNATVDLSSYASGVYFARITTENGVVTKRVVKK